MPKPTIFQQLPGATQVLPEKLLSSPRHWNAGLIRFGDRLWLAYRFHRSADDPRCAIAICQISEKTLQPTGKSQVLPLSCPTGSEHQEDPRLFVFKGKLHIGYTEMTAYRPNVSYACVMKYARLKESAGKWTVEREFYPKFGQNNGYSKEKNWVFFEVDGKLFFIYQSHPHHVVLEMDGETVGKEYMSQSPFWSWGEMRGGASPVRDGDKFIHVFHSSLPTEEPPHYVRYYAGVYTFSARPPFAPIAITPRPLAVGSEFDGHKVDPRNTNGWKPFVVFPCGLVEQAKRGEYLVSLGINDWSTVIAPFNLQNLSLVQADGQTLPPRFFKTRNGNRPQPVRMVVEGGSTRTEWLNWEVPRPRAGFGGLGYMMIRDQRIAEDLAQERDITEIAVDEYESAVSGVVA